MASLTCLVVSQDCQPASLSSLPCWLSNKILQVSNVVHQCSRRRLLQCVSTYQAFPCITWADAPLAKARSMGGPRVNVGGNYVACASRRLHLCHNRPQTPRPLRSFQCHHSSLHFSGDVRSHFWISGIETHLEHEQPTNSLRSPRWQNRDDLSPCDTQPFHTDWHFC